MFSDDMRRMIVDMYKLRNELLSLQGKTELLKRVFGESVASRAIKSQLDAGRHEMQAGQFNVYEYTLALDPTKVVGSLTLPNDANLEVLAIDVLP